MNCMTELCHRVEQLERELNRCRRSSRRSRVAMLAMFVGAIGMISIAADDLPGVADVIQTQRLEIVDEEGRLLLAAAGDARGGRLDVWTTSGANAVRVSTNSAGGDVNLWNNEGATVLAAYSGTHGGELGVWNKDDQRIAHLAPAEKGAQLTLGGQQGSSNAVINSTGDECSLALRNAAGHAVVHAGIDQHGSGNFTTRNAKAMRVFSVEADPQTGSALTLASNEGDRKVALSADNGGGSISFYNDASIAVMAAGVAEPAGNGFVDLYNAGGTRVLSAIAATDGCGRLDLATVSGQSVVTIDADAKRGGALAMFDARGRRSMLAGSHAEGGLLNIFNQHEVPVVAAGYAPESLGGALSIMNGRGISVIQATADAAERGLVRVYDQDGEQVRIVNPLPGLR